MAVRKETLLRALLRVLLFLGCIATWSGFAVLEWVPDLQRPHWPDSSYWVAGRLATEGRGPLVYADPAVFVGEAVRLGTVGDTFAGNLPTTILPFVPLGLLPELVARDIWLFLMLVCFILAWGILLHALRLAVHVRLALWGLVPLFHPLIENFVWGQVYPLLLLLLVAGEVLVAAPRRAAQHPRQALVVAAGVMYGLLAVVKYYYGAILLLPLAMRRQWVLLLPAAGLFGVGVVITAIWWGPAIWGTAIGASLNWQANAATAIPAYQTVDGWLMHLLRYDPTVNPEPLTRHPMWVQPLWGAITAILAGCSLLAWSRAAGRPARTPAEPFLAAALAVLLALVLAPIATEYHYGLALFPLVVAGGALGGNGGRPRPAAGWERPGWRPLGAWAIWMIAVALLGVDWQFNVLGVGGWQALLNYPRLYGALLLWGQILVLLWRPAGPRGSTRAGEGRGRRGPGAGGVA